MARRKSITRQPSLFTGRTGGSGGGGTKFTAVTKGDEVISVQTGEDAPTTEQKVQEIQQKAQAEFKQQKIQEISKKQEAVQQRGMSEEFAKKFRSAVEEERELERQRGEEKGGRRFAEVRGRGPTRTILLPSPQETVEEKKEGVIETLREIKQEEKGFLPFLSETTRRGVRFVGRKAGETGLVSIGSPGIVGVGVQKRLTPEQAATTFDIGSFLLPGIGGARFATEVGALGEEFVRRDVPAKQFYQERKFEIITTAAVGALAIAPKVFRATGQVIRTEKVAFKTKEGEKAFRTFGLEFRGRALPLVTKTEEGIKFGVPRIKNAIPLTELTAPVQAPRTGVGTKALTRVLETTAPERQRIFEIQEQIRILGREKGLPVKDVFFNIPQLKKPKETSRIFESFIAEKEGVVFGTATTQQLPKGFRTTVGDVDVLFPKAIESELVVGVRETAKRARAVGENLRVSRKNPLVIETPKGEKIFEAKAGISPTMISGTDIAPVGGLGFDFPLIKKGRIGKTVPFGKAKAITAGEQLTRKGVASVFFRAAEFGKTPKAFQVAGVFPLGRRAKDLPGFIIQSRGLAEVVGGARKQRAIVSSEKLIQTFTTEQQKAIQVGILERQVTSFRIIGESTKKEKQISPLIIGSFKEKRFSPQPFIQEQRVSPSPIISPKPSPSPRISPSISPKISPSISPVISPSARISPSISPRTSPSISPKISPSISPKISPSLSPKVSPSPSPKISPSISPSPRVSPSPFIEFPKTPRTTLIPPPPSIRLKPIKEKTFDMGARYAPSLVGLEFGVRGRKPSKVTGVGVRPFVKKGKIPGIRGAIGI